MLPFFEKKDEELFCYNFKNFDFPPHFHPALEALVVESGELYASLESEKRLVREGEIFLAFPGCIHSYETESGSENSGFVILLGKTLLPDYSADTEKYRPQDFIQPLGDLHKDCKNALFTLRGASDKPQRVQRAYAQMFLCHIFEGKMVEAQNKTDELLYRTIGYMEEHFPENISLSSAAEALYVSKYRLSRVFSSALSTGFNDYLNSLRIRRAMNMIENNLGTFSSVAYEVGFENVRTFNRAFKKLVGMTPTEFRKKGL